MIRQPRTKRVTILDVARQAGVSHTTVSFVINNVVGASISEETRARVRAAVEELGFHPHAGARSIGRRATYMLGVAIPDANNPHFNEIVAGVESYAAQHGYDVFLSITHFDAEREQRSFALLQQQRIDGLILIPSHGDVLHELHVALRQGFPIATLGIYDNAVDNVRPEVDVGEQQVIEHLAGLGHRRIGYIYGVADHAAFSYRLDACVRIQGELGLPVEQNWICRCGPTVAESYRSTQELLARCSPADRPTALVVVNDVLAHGVIAALQQAHVPVPAAMSVASFDNTAQAAFAVYPALTTVDYQAALMGQRAAQMIIDRLANPQLPPSHQTVSAQLVVRQSSGPAPTLPAA